MTRFSNLRFTKLKLENASSRSFNTSIVGNDDFFGFGSCCFFHTNPVYPGGVFNFVLITEVSFKPNSEKSHRLLYLKASFQN
jgi:hypothetical protein